MNETANHDVSAQAAQLLDAEGLSKPKRLSNQSCYCPPKGSKPATAGQPLGFSVSVVPVSSVARDWGVSARRVRVMLSTGRLAGQQLENGYWEVFYPYRYVFGTRGPPIKRQREQPDKPKKQERIQDRNL